MVFYYRPHNRTWWPHKPFGHTGKQWDSNKMVLDWSTGKIVDPSQTTVPTGDHGKNKPDLKLHIGGPYNGARLRKYVYLDVTPKTMTGSTVKRGSSKVKRQVDIIPSKYEVPGFAGWYDYEPVADVYRWHTH